MDDKNEINFDEFPIKISEIDMESLKNNIYKLDGDGKYTNMATGNSTKDIKSDNKFVLDFKNNILYFSGTLQPVMFEKGNDWIGAINNGLSAIQGACSKNEIDSCTAIINYSKNIQETAFKEQVCPAGNICVFGETGYEGFTCRHPSTGCQTGEHLKSDGSCEKDSIQNCGAAGNDCSNIPGWVDGYCENAKCIASKCDKANGYKLEKGRCIAWCKPGQVSCEYSVDDKGERQQGCESADNCYTECINPNNDLVFCGASILDDANCNSSDPESKDFKGLKCNRGEVCSYGNCGLSCNAGLANCNGICINLEDNHVASCGTTSEQLVCIEGYANCDNKVENGCETNIKGSDVANCGACNKACESGQVCSTGTYGLSCQAGMTNCGGICIKKDETHVESCSEDNSELLCIEGYKNCDGKVENGCEVLVLGTDTANCGECNNSCQPGEVCSLGSCGLSCQGGLDICGGICINRGETHISSCNKDNSELECLEGYANCDNKVENGCETNIKSSDVGNCGACNKACESGQVCSTGTCGLSCQAGMTNCGGICIKKDETHVESCSEKNTKLICLNGYANCDGKISNGCETNIKGSDVGNCGACNKACDSGQVCAAGSCGLSCQSGFTNCGGQCINKGETHVSSCKENSTTLTCISGYANCDGNIANGCETNIKGSDVGNCGACNKACDSGQVCAAGSCGLSCQSGFTNCGGQCINKGETHVNSCTSTSTTLTCVDGYKNCDGKVSNGCEINSITDTSNCGSCGNACESGQMCVDGCCQKSCESGTYSCPGIPGCVAADVLNSYYHMTTECECKFGYFDADMDWSNGCEEPSE